MADRENVKIVISAALIVVVASMGIYAFIYRDKISQMLPKWQSKEKVEERIIQDDPIQSPPTSEEGIPERNETTQDTKDLEGSREIQKYPKIPNLDEETEKTNQLALKNQKDSPSEKQGVVDAPKKTPKVSIEPYPEKKTPETASGKEKEEKAQKTPTKSTVYKAPVSSSQKTKTSPKKKKTTYRKKKSTEKTPSQYKKLVSKTKPKTSYKPNRKTTPPRKSSPQPTKTASRSLDQRIKNLEKKLNVHVQNTNSRLDSLEKRVDRLEKKLGSN